ncbi:hypothetical protein AVEN_195356-1 [Araneus ventricosus]|uniref:Uncharacterized protein n=1 Tax=Araneus ventricosus TaxID=182803 RepID=A0A4Y2DHL5_ARAVE|nr:hypothetical protein AVEN_195356-1 [Araneus ventricosus]
MWECPSSLASEVKWFFHRLQKTRSRMLLVDKASPLKVPRTARDGYAISDLSSNGSQSHYVVVLSKRLDKEALSRGGSPRA